VTLLRVVLSDVVFVYLKNFDDLVPLLHGDSHFIDDPRTGEGPFGERLVPTFILRVLLDGGRLTQAEQKFVITAKRQHGMVKALGR